MSMSGMLKCNVQVSLANDSTVSAEMEIEDLPRSKG